MSQLYTFCGHKHISGSNHNRLTLKVNALPDNNHTSLHTSHKNMGMHIPRDVCITYLHPVLFVHSTKADTTHRKM